MNDRGKRFAVPASALRDVATDEQVERVWRRIEDDLSGTPARTFRSAPIWAWAPAAGVAVFAIGVFVGSRWAQVPPEVGVDLKPESVKLGGPPTSREAPTSSVDEPEEPEEKKARQKNQPVPGRLGKLQLAPPPNESSVPAPGPMVQSVPEWQRFCDEGQYEKARADIQQRGGFESVLGKASPDQLMLLFDVARVSREHAYALGALRKVVNDHPNSPYAPYAAYQLGLMLNKAGDLAGAARAFAAYRGLSPDGDFSEDALARQVEAAIEQGELARARELAAQYDREFPTGDGLDELREKLQAETRDAGAGQVAESEGAEQPEDSAEQPEDSAELEETEDSEHSAAPEPSATAVPEDGATASPPRGDTP